MLIFTHQARISKRREPLFGSLKKTGNDSNMKEHSFHCQVDNVDNHG